MGFRPNFRKFRVARLSTSTKAAWFRATNACAGSAGEGGIRAISVCV